MVVVASRAETRDFLVSRRARVTPQQAGLPDDGRRRVPGLRRSEVAALAGVSVEYLTQLERGNLGGASEQVLDALARALRLDEAERTHLFDLARTAASPGRTNRRAARTSTLRPSVQRLLDTQGSPAYVRNGRGDILAANTLCTALYGDVLNAASLPVSVPRFVFLDPRSVEFFLDWDTVADDTAASLRIQAGANPDDRQLSDLVGELATRSDAFAARWARHNVRLHRTATKRLHNAVVGELELTGDALELPGEDLTMIVYTAPAGSPAQEKLDFLARWAGDATARPAAAAGDAAGG